MFGCRKYQGLIAVSLYEELSERDQRLLETHLASCDSCRSDAAALGALVNSIPAEKPDLGYDLTPVLRARLRETAEAPARVFFPRWALLASAACFVLVVGILVGTNQTAHAPGVAPSEAMTAGVASDGAEASPLESMLAKADSFIETREFTKAYSVLDEAVRENPGDAFAGKAQERLADVAFAKLAWYDKAYDAYDTLAEEYGDIYQANRTNIERLNLLAEAGKVGFASLHAYDAARQDRADPLGRLQAVISAYPSTYVASMAACEVGRVGAGADGNVEGRLLAMKNVRDASADPVVRAQMDLEMGHICRNERNDPASAREYYVRASESPVLARLAQDAIVSLDSGSR